MEEEIKELVLELLSRFYVHKSTQSTTLIPKPYTAEDNDSSRSFPYFALASAFNYKFEEYPKNDKTRNHT